MTTGIAAPEQPSPVRGGRALLPSTSTVRFTMLIALVVVTSAACGIYVSMLSGSVGRLARSVEPCLGVGQVQPGDLAGAASAAGLKCFAPLRGAVSVAMLAVAIAVLIAAYLLYLVLPWWRIRRHRLTPLPHDADALRAHLDSLVRECGLARSPTFLLAPYNRVGAGLAFGRQGQPMIQLNAGLIPFFVLDRKTFRAVVLHELAHVSNRDIGRTYFTVAVWRAFLVVALAPFVILNIFPSLILGPDHLALFDKGNDLIRSEKIQIVVGVAALTALIYLTRAAVLRNRENLADATAAARGAEALSPILGQAVRRPTDGPIAALFRVHPAPALRLRYIEDRSLGYRFDLGEVFAAGIVISSICTSVMLLVEVAMRATVAVFLDEYANTLQALVIAAIYTALIAFYFSVVYWRVAVGTATCGRIRTPSLAATAGAMTLGLLLGEPLSVAGALAGRRFGVFGSVGMDGTIASGIAWAILLFGGVILLARWIRDSAALRMAGRRQSTFPSSYLGTAAIGGGAFLCGFWVWYMLHLSVAGSRFDLWTAAVAQANGESYGAQPGATWIRAQYQPLEFLGYVPFATLLLALPCVYVIIASLSGSPAGGATARIRLRPVLMGGLIGAALFVVVTAAANVLAAQRINDMVGRYPGTGVYLLYCYFVLAQVFGAAVGGAVAAFSPRLRITLGLAAWYLTGTIAAASMPFTLALRRCVQPETGGPTLACLGRAPLSIYPTVYNEILTRGAAAAIVAGLAVTAAAQVGRALRAARPDRDGVSDRDAPEATAMSSRTRLGVVLATTVLAGIALTTTVANSVDFFTPP